MTDVLLVAAETSSVLYAQKLIEAAQQERRDLRFFGVGNRDMENLGFECLGRSEEMAVVGIFEVLKHYFKLRKVFYRILAEVDARKPALAILMDYPGFNLRLAKELKSRGVKVIYYVAPQIWAWKQNRVHSIKNNCDLVLSLFPFETQFYEKFQVPVKFVGHPLLDEIDSSWLDPKSQILKRRQSGIGDEEFVLGFMPGSRESELRYHFPIMLETAKEFLRRHKNGKVLFLVAPNYERSDWEKYFENFNWPFMLIKDNPFKMMELCDGMVAASGTATLMVGMMRVPMVIIYRFHFLTALIAKMIVAKDQMFGLINVLLGEKKFPELFQEQATADKILSYVDQWLEKPQYYQQQRNELETVTHLLGERGATLRVWNIVRGYLP